MTSVFFAARKKILRLFLAMFLMAYNPMTGWALLPEEILVVANRFVPESVDVARYYMEKRGIPEQNLLKVTTSEKETISRKYYDKEIAKPVRQAVVSNPAIKCLVTIYGVPLKVAPPELARDDKVQLKALTEDRSRLRSDLKKITDKKSARHKTLKKEIDKLNKQIKLLQKKDYSAAVDSELTLVLDEGYSLELWQPNPYFVGYQKNPTTITKSQVVMVSRLDGASVDQVERIIDDSLAAEQKGLSGNAYFDARWPPKDGKQLKGYALYDQSLHLAAEKVKNRLPGFSVVVNDNQALFKPGEAPLAAIYCGWYSLGKYVDAFDWQMGAIGYHIASIECESLRRSNFKGWCKGMLDDGAAAVIGPVGEPYVQAFPLPEIFFYYLTDGYYTIVESYFLSLPYLSWRMVLIGDPLYRPFANKG